MRLPTLNGVWVYGAEPDGQATGALLDRVAATGLPYCLQAPVGVTAMADLAARRGMHPEGEIPLMVLEEIEAAPATAPAQLRIRELGAAELGEHTRLAAAGFEVDEEYFRGLVTPELARLDGMRTYVGEVDGDPVTTGVGYTDGDWVGVFNIATPAAHRRRGYGAAVTMRAVRDGVTAGARCAWLQASEAGRPVYEQLGFRTVASWACWIGAGPSPV